MADHTEFEPGEVALIEVGTPLRWVPAILNKSGTAWLWVNNNGRPRVDIYGDHSKCHVVGKPVRRVLLLDPDEPLRIMTLLRSHAESIGDDDPTHRDVQEFVDTIKRFTAPRMPEPGQWGVVKARHTADDGLGPQRTWVSDGTTWHEVGGPLRRTWEQLVDPEIVREGT